MYRVFQGICCYIKETIVGYAVILDFTQIY